MTARRSQESKGEFQMNRIRTLVWPTLFLIATSAITAGAAPFAYVANLGGGGSVIDAATNTGAGVGQVGVGPQGGGITPKGAFAHLANFTANNLAVINTATNTLLTTVPVGSGPRGVAITPNGAFAYVANSISNDVSVINTATNTVIATVASGAIAGGPFGVAITPNGAFV